MMARLGPEADALFMTLKEDVVRIAGTFRKAAVVATLGSMVASGFALAEKMDCSSSKKSKRMVSSEVIKPGDRPDRELVQIVRIDVVSSANPEFDGAEQTVYGHSDQIGGTGSHNGYSVTTLKSGEKLWTKYEGVHHRTKKGDTWETRVQGISRFIEGTGKYTAIRGGSYYQGVTTPAGYTQETVCEAEY